MPGDTHQGPSPVAASFGAEAPLTGGAIVRGLLLVLIAGLALAGGHLGLAKAWPSLTGLMLKPAVNLALYVANLFLVSSLLLGVRPLRPRALAGHAVGYAAMIWLLWPLLRVMDENFLLLVLVILVYGGLVRRPHLLGYLFIYLVCLRFLPAYLYPAFLLVSLLYMTVPPFARAAVQDRERFVPLCHLAGLILLAALLMPIVYFCTQSTPQDIDQRFREPEVIAALGVSLKTSALATLIVLVLGVPLAYAVVRRPFPGRGLIDTLIDLPIVVPAPIAGITLLAFLGPKSPLGEFLDARLGIRFFDSEWGIIAAQVFVASPFLIRASMVAFAAVDVRYENVARTLGASTMSAFLRITLPMSMRGILIGVILTWFRAMAEFGALNIMANRPRTIPILAYERFVEFQQTEAQSVGVMVLLMSLGVVVGMWIIRAMPRILGRSIGASDATR